MKECDCKIPTELKEKVREVIKDNKGKLPDKEVSSQDITEEVNAINPDENTLDRG